jgi:hypothetical protein
LNLFVSLALLFFDNFIIYLICEFLLWNTNLICDIYLFFFNKKITKNMYDLLSIQILLVYLLTLESGIPYFFYVT